MEQTHRQANFNGNEIQKFRSKPRKGKKTRVSGNQKGTPDNKSHTYLSLFHEKFGLNTIIRAKSTNMFLIHHSFFCKMTTNCITMKFQARTWHLGPTRQYKPFLFGKSG